MSVRWLIFRVKCLLDPFPAPFRESRTEGTEQAPVIERVAAHDATNPHPRRPPDRGPTDPNARAPTRAFDRRSLTHRARTSPHPRLAGRAARQRPPSAAHEHRRSTLAALSLLEAAGLARDRRPARAQRHRCTRRRHHQARALAARIGWCVAFRVQRLCKLLGAACALSVGGRLTVCCPLAIPPLRPRRPSSRPQSSTPSSCSARSWS